MRKPPHANDLDLFHGRVDDFLDVLSTPEQQRELAQRWQITDEAQALSVLDAREAEALQALDFRQSLDALRVTRDVQVCQRLVSGKVIKGEPAVAAATEHEAFKMMQRWVGKQAAGRAKKNADVQDSQTRQLSQNFKIDRLLQRIDRQVDQVRKMQKVLKSKQYP